MGNPLKRLNSGTLAIFFDRNLSKRRIYFSVTPEEVLQANDMLYFTGGIEHVKELLDQFPHGLKSVEGQI